MQTLSLSGPPPSKNVSHVFKKVLRRRMVRAELSGEARWQPRGNQIAAGTCAPLPRARLSDDQHTDRLQPWICWSTGWNVRLRRDPSPRSTAHPIWRGRGSRNRRRRGRRGRRGRRRHPSATTLLGRVDQRLLRFLAPAAREVSADRPRRLGTFTHRLRPVRGLITIEAVYATASRMPCKKRHAIALCTGVKYAP